jgi:hypothetical protein
MRIALSVGLAMVLALGAAPQPAAAQDAPAAAAAAEPWTSEELENLLAPIALYPDPILAQVLIAATFPDQIALAAAYVKVNGTVGLDEQPWEISVRAVAHYAPVLNLMAEGEDWTIALGQAYAEQPNDVMGAVQSLRRMANAQGNLVSSAEQQVIVEREVIRIVPAQPRVVYVPTYDPAVIYFRPVYVTHAHPAYWSWGIGYPIGVWLTYDFDWYSHRVYYHGWYGGGWIVASRPWVVINPYYVSPRFSVIFVNRHVVHRSFNPHRIHHRYVHRHVSYDRHGRWDGRRDVGRGDRRDGGWDGGRDDDRGRARPGRGDDDRGGRDGDRDGGRRATPRPTSGRTVARNEIVRKPDWVGADRSPARTAPTGTATPRANPTRTATPRPSPTRATPRPTAAPRTSRTTTDALRRVSASKPNASPRPSTAPRTSRTTTDALRRVSASRPSASPRSPRVATSSRPSRVSTSSPRPSRVSTASPRPSRVSNASPRPSRSGSTASAPSRSAPKASKPSGGRSNASSRPARSSSNSARSARASGRSRN